MKSLVIRKPLTIPLAILVGIVSLSLSGVGFAQEPQGQPAGQPPQTSPSVPEADLEAFADAQKEASEITLRFQQEAQAVDDPAQIAQMREQANAQMVQAVRDAGLEPERYNVIAQAVRSNPQLAEKVRALME